MSQSRRLAAILAADIAGYSALMGSDEARTVRDLKGHQAVVLPMVGDFGDFGGPFLLRLLLGLGPLASSWSRHGDLNVKLGAMSGVTESCYGIPRYLSSLQRLSPEMVDAVQ